MKKHVAILVIIFTLAIPHGLMAQDSDFFI